MPNSDTMLGYLAFGDDNQASDEDRTAAPPYMTATLQVPLTDTQRQAITNYLQGLGYKVGNVSDEALIQQYEAVAYGGAINAHHGNRLVGTATELLIVGLVIATVVVVIRWRNGRR
jgi:hypothetical protein